MSEVNNSQVGGTHYNSKMQHWDLVTTLQLPYFIAQITRYVTRWRKKNGLEDLEKALHYTLKYIEVREQQEAQSTELLEHYCRENTLTEEEARVFNMLVHHDLGDIDRLYYVRDSIKSLLTTLRGGRADPVFLVERDEWK